MTKSMNQIREGLELTIKGLLNRVVEVSKGKMNEAKPSKITDLLDEAGNYIRETESYGFKGENLNLLKRRYNAMIGCKTDLIRGEI